jgi:uncharacterized protein (DUF58 family)
MRLTREGKRFFLATVLIALAAVNTGNNLIYLILSLMLSFMLISLVVLKINLSGLSLEVAAEGPAFAGGETTVSVALTNRKRFIPSYSVRISDPGLSDTSYFTIIHPGESAIGKMDIIFPRRGLYNYGDFSMKSGFPFILLSSEENAGEQGEVLVYPALLDIDKAVGLLPAGLGHGVAKSAGPGDEIFSIREFRDGDDWRKIHWKASAKAEGLLVRDYAESEVMKMTLLVDNLDTGIMQDSISLPKVRENDHYDAAFEKMVSVAGSLAKHFLDRGYHVRVVTCRKVIPFGSGDEHLFKILDIFALLRKENRCDNILPPDGEGLFISLVPAAAYSSAFGVAGDVVVHADIL